ncbi:HDIG domain-containing metalloprotein [[Mycoplasma] imitans]|uniref:HDIG domain-containing metalloprotein n=1 Tax=[Mycoplasma] imitans TaxID=29560 RepID=UPI0005611972|nr:HDIG domain-containing metalloprotein [[Mycoplasma] imitans]
MNVSILLMYLIVGLLTALAFLLLAFILLKFLEFRFFKQTEMHQREIEQEILKINKQEELEEKLKEHYLFQESYKELTRKDLKEIRNFFVSVLSSNIVLENTKEKLFGEIKERKRENDELRAKLEAKKVEDKITLLREMKLTHEEARNQLLEEYRGYVRNDLDKMVKEEEKAANNKRNGIANELNKILINAMNNANLLTDMVRMGTLKTIEYEYVDDDQVKAKKFTDDFYGKLIGKEGKNKEYIEKLFNVALSIKPHLYQIEITSFNTIKLEVAYNAMNKIVEAVSEEGTHVLNENLIKKCWYGSLNEFTAEAKRVGEETLKDLGLYESSFIPSKEICEYIGRLKYRGSNTQNVLTHSIEAAQIAESIAEQLNLNKEKAKVCALLHDIGKAIDKEIVNGEGRWKNLKYAANEHVSAGVAIAQHYKMDIDIIDAINCHHGRKKLYEKSKNFYAKITRIADFLSAARPGVRFIKDNDLENRFDAIAKIMNNYVSKELINTYKILKNGYNIDVMINPNVSENEFRELTIDLKRDLESDEELSKLAISITYVLNITKTETTNAAAHAVKPVKNEVEDLEDNDDSNNEEYLNTVEYVEQ